MREGAFAREPPALANGVRYAVLHRPGADVTTVSVWILAGSRHESVPGVAHLLEHAVQAADVNKVAEVMTDRLVAATAGPSPSPAHSPERRHR